MSESRTAAPNATNKKSTTGTYAKLFWRAPAFLVDLVIVVTISALLVILLADGWPVAFGSAIPQVAGAAVFLCVLWLYPAVLDSSEWKGTVGKRLFGLRTLDLSGRRISFRTGVKRGAVRVASSMLCLLGYAGILITARRQTLHDWATRTVVIYLPGQSPAAAAFGWLPRAWRARAGKFESAWMILLTALMVVVLGKGVLTVVSPTLVQIEAGATVAMAFDRIAPLQDYIGRERSKGQYPRQIDPRLVDSMSLPPGVVIRYFPEIGVVDIVFETNALLKSHVVSLVPNVVGNDVKWVCRSSGLDPAFLASRCRAD